MPATKSVMVAACRRFMKPIARLLIRSGITSREFGELCKTTFVEVAREDHGLRGNPANWSRVAILTGLSRKEVLKVRENLGSLDAGLGGPDRAGHASRVMAGWYTDPRFVTPDGVPRELAVSGDEPSFTTLMRAHGGDMPPGALLRELKSAGAVEERDGGRLRALRRAFMPSQLDPVAIERSALVLHDMITTVTYNLYRAEDAPSRFEGRAVNARVTKAALPKFRRHIEKEGERFLFAIDDWLSAHEHKDDNASPGSYVRLAVGVYAAEQAPARGRQT